MGAVEVGDRSIGDLLEEREQVVEAVDGARGVVAEDRHRGIETGAWGDALRGDGHLGLDAVQLAPAPGVHLEGISVHAERPPNADCVELRPHRIGFRRLGRVVLAQEARESGVCLGGGLRPIVQACCERCRRGFSTAKRAK